MRSYLLYFLVWQWVVVMPALGAEYTSFSLMPLPSGVTQKAPTTVLPYEQTQTSFGYVQFKDPGLDYPTAQSSSAKSAGDGINSFGYPSHGNFANLLSGTPLTHFRQPDCTAKSLSWASKYETLERTFAISRVEALTREGNVPWPSGLIEHSFYNPTMTNPHMCCGSCRVGWPDVSVAYWPVEGANTECLAGIKTLYGDVEEPMRQYLDSDIRTQISVGTRKTFPSPVDTWTPAAAKRSFVPFPIITPGPKMKRGDKSLLVTSVGSDGFIYTSPSIYFEVATVYADDDCGFVGNAYSKLRWSYLPEQVSSVVPKDWSCWGVFYDEFGGVDLHEASSECSFTTKQFDFADLPCPPEHLRVWAGSSFIFNPTVAYAPMIAPPPDLTRLDRAWSTCTANVGWDPYTALAPFASLAVKTSNTGPVQSPSATPAKTASSPAAAETSKSHVVVHTAASLETPTAPTKTSSPVHHSTHVQQPEKSSSAPSKKSPPPADKPTKAHVSDVHSPSPSPSPEPVADHLSDPTKATQPAASVVEVSSPSSKHVQTRPQPQIAPSSKHAQTKHQPETTRGVTPPQAVGSPFSLLPEHSESSETYHHPGSAATGSSDPTNTPVETTPQEPSAPAHPHSSPNDAHSQQATHPATSPSSPDPTASGKTHPKPAHLPTGGSTTSPKSVPTSTFPKHKTKAAHLPPSASALPTAFVLDSSITLHEGHATTVSGTAVSDASGKLVVGTSTVLPNTHSEKAISGEAAHTGMGGLIWSALGGKHAPKTEGVGTESSGATTVSSGAATKLASKTGGRSTTSALATKAVPTKGEMGTAGTAGQAGPTGFPVTFGGVASSETAGANGDGAVQKAVGARVRCWSWGAGIAVAVAGVVVLVV